ncbi:hypothetical protein C8J56DRAFT_917673 [Mycena floridula]|nr:hypothetical protein C8J56DRAFT_917673 [Mycena floridula]
MPINPTQKVAIEQVIDALTSLKSRKRVISEVFLDLVDREQWPEYYEVIPAPRCIEGVRSSLATNSYNEPLDAYTDLALVFWNALYFNDESSQIAADAETLKTALETEWKSRPVLPVPSRNSPPPSSAQKVHGIVPSAPAQPVADEAESSDTDIDVEASDSEYEDVAIDHEQDARGAEFVKELEANFPAWPGYSEEGWMKDVKPTPYFDIVNALKGYKDSSSGDRLAAVLENLPEQSTGLNLSYTGSLTLKLIEARSRHKQYQTAKHFDLDMTRIFEKARRYQDPTSDSYGRIVLLQRFYQALTATNPPQGPPYSSATNFSSIRLGPGNIKLLQDENGGVTTQQIITKDRTFLEHVDYKGLNVKIGDWVHLSNPDDPARPIVAQVFRCWSSDEEEKKGQLGVTVSWYYRPEQTFHPSDKKFWEGEVFKSSHYCEHALEDILEKIACQFTSRHIRGRPRPPHWYPGIPLYVCDARYNDRDRSFTKIKNWMACIPDQIKKKSEYMPVEPFERAVFPNRVSSPFLGKSIINGPGALTDHIAASKPVEVKRAPSKARASTPAKAKIEPAPTPTAATVAAAALTALSTTPTVFPQNTSIFFQAPQQQYQRPATSDRSVLMSAGGTALANNFRTEKLSPEITKHFDRDPDTNELLWFPGAPVDLVRPAKPKHSLKYLHFLAMKRKREQEEDEWEDAMDVVDDSKRQRVRPTVTETLRAILRDESVETL